MNQSLYYRGKTGLYRGYPAVVLEHTVSEFIIAYRKDGKWVLFSGARAEDFDAPV